MLTYEELKKLHNLMGVYGRLYIDLQKQRITLGNRISAFVREQGGSVGLTEDSTVFKIQMLAGVPEYEHLLLMFKMQDQMEQAATNHLQKLAKQHPMADWIKSTRGIGLQSLGVLLSLTGPLDQFPTVSKLWKYLGLHVTEAGTAGKRRKGQPFIKRADADELGVEATAYNPTGRVLCHQIGEAIVKVGGPYRALYDTKKAAYKLRQPDGPSACVFGQVHKDSAGKIIQCGDAHAHNAAMRYAVKCLIRDMWIEWRRVVPESDGHAPSDTQAWSAVARELVPA